MTSEAFARKLHHYFCGHREEAVRRGQQQLAALPDVETIREIIDAAFWASLRREEGYVPKISLAFLSPEQSSSPIVLDRHLPLSPEALARVSPAVERPGIHMGVWRVEGEMCVWGMTRNIPVLCFVLEVAAPGLIVVKHHSGNETRKFINVAVLEGDQIKMVDECVSGKPGCPALLTSLLGFESAGSWIQSVNTMVKRAVSMRAHGRGGSLLVVPANTEEWRESIVQPIPYAVSSPFCELTPIDDPIVAAVAGLTAVDGAVVMTDRYELLGFGAKIVRRKKMPQVEQVTITEPIEGAKPLLVHPEQLGGTRHFSAAQFIQDQHDSVALVASQDGRFTIFEWSQNEQMVHAHRLDALLL
jgi:hypothetical protein